MVYTYNEIFCSFVKKKQIMYYVTTWMNLEDFDSDFN